MDIPSLLLSLALLGLVVFIIARPVLEKQAVRLTNSSKADELTAQRELVLAALRDLDFDHATGKLTAEDYQPQRAVLVGQGVEILKQLDALSDAPLDLEATLEQAVAARRTTKAKTTCPNCGRPIQAEDAFCSKCGAKISIPNA